jgi:hypothetical protein
MFDRPKPTAGCSANERRRRRLAYHFWNAESRLVISEVIWELSFVSKVNFK